MRNYIHRTSTSELYDLLKKLNVPNVYICRKGELKNVLKNKKIKNIIINLDDIGNGTHWTALNTTKKLYFDSYAQSPAIEIPKKYKLASTNKEIESISAEDCGQLCALWLYYINYKSNSDYYKLFKDCY